MFFLLTASAARGVDFGADFAPTTAANMNGEYPFAPTPGGTPGKMPKNFRDYPGGVEAFDVVSPAMTTYYSQVWWSPLAPVALPKEVVAKYANKKMAIVGWEIDQIRYKADGTEVSVPISVTYNHHYNANMIGAAQRFKKVMLSGPNDPHMAELMKQSHGSVALDQPHYVVENVDGTSGGTSLFMASGNGGEYRKTYHGYAPGFALVIESPTELQVSPMQIDTWNRDEMDIDSPLPPKFVAGPLPRSSEAPEGAEYSGLLECPMTSRLTKDVDGAYLVESNGTRGCAGGEPIRTYQECFHAANATLWTGGQTLTTTVVADAARPLGCSATTAADDTGNSHINVVFNTLANSTAPCGGAKKLRGATALAGVEGVILDVALDASADVATITLTGPADVWFGFGFGAVQMGDRPWTVVVEVDATTRKAIVSERKLGGPNPNTHVEGDLLKPSVTLVSDTLSASGATRVVVLTRALKGAGAEYYSFDARAATATVDFIAAVGTSAKLSYHKGHEPSKLALLPIAGPGACICPEQPAAFGQGAGTLIYNANANETVDTGTGAVAFRAGKCPPFPRTVLIEQRNPTCDIRHYRGGQWACHHKWSLLDADQTIPWTDTPLVFHHKWRIYVQPYNASYHQALDFGFEAALTIGSTYEYDVPACAGPGGGNMPGCAYDAKTATWIHTISGTILGSKSFAQLNFHCHAPTCLSMSVYKCDKALNLENCNATVGELICEQHPVYGGSGAAILNGTRFDEPGYIAIPDCIWGSDEFGLEAPWDLTGLPLHVVKTANATWPHYGEMAGGQPWVFDATNSAA